MANQEFGKMTSRLFDHLLQQTILLHLAENVKIDYSKHPRKMANQEFAKTTFPTFGPSFEKSLATLKSNYSKHPRKMDNQEFGKTASQDFEPSFANFLRIYNPQHNGVHVTTLLFIKKSIKVRSAKWGGRTLKK